VEKERIIKDRLQRLIEGIRKADYKDCDKEYMARLAEERINELQTRGVYDIDKFVRILTDRVNDKEDYLDILMEGRFAVILARNNFSHIHIEYADGCPDLKANWNKYTVYFEVTRKRPSEDDKRFSHPGAGAYWAEHAESEDIIGKIQGKMRQLQSGEVNIVVLWSDAIAWHHSALEKAFGYIKQEICDDQTRYKDLSAILFTKGGGVSSGRLKPFYLFKNDKASKPLGTRLARKLESLHERNPKQLQREFEELAAALKRIRAKR